MEFDITFNPGKAYRQNHHNRMYRSLIASLVIVLGFSFLARHISVRGNRFSDVELNEFEALQVELIKNIKKPEIKVFPQVQKIEPVVEVPEQIKTPIKAVPEKKKRPEAESIQFNLDDVSANLTSHSALGQINSSSARRGRNSAFDADVNIGANLDVGRLNAGPSDFDISLDTEVKTRQRADTAPKVKLPVREPKHIEQPKMEEDAPDNDLLQADVSVVLTSSDINIDINEYPLWNRINAEFDRWDKGRYGSLPKHLKRLGRSIVAHVGFSDGTAQKIIWKRGATKILVQGNSKRTRIDELRQAVSALTRLNLNKTRS
ncbi:MAG: hypothetical protein DWQ10_02680 [Calditrichaeota bacterium]|nr:MAG: hypothetical protein DWQ10_02680 [Calditrichota bacterium]